MATGSGSTVYIWPASEIGFTTKLCEDASEIGFTTKLCEDASEIGFTTKLCEDASEIGLPQNFVKMPQK